MRSARTGARGGPWRTRRKTEGTRGTPVILSPADLFPFFFIFEYFGFWEKEETRFQALWTEHLSFLE